MMGSSALRWCLGWVVTVAVLLGAGCSPTAPSDVATPNASETATAAAVQAQANQTLVAGQVLLVTLSGTTIRSSRILARAATDPSFQLDGNRVLFRSLASAQDGRAEGIFVSDIPTNSEFRIDGAPDDFSPIFINQGHVLFSSTGIAEGGKKQYRLLIATLYNS